MTTMKESLQEIVTRTYAELDVNKSDKENLNILLQFLDEISGEVS